MLGMESPRKLLKASSLLLSILLFGIPSAQCLENGLARKPIMGWSSWNCFNVKVYEFQTKEIAEALISIGMRELGYEYVIIDGGWESGPFFPRDGNGELIADPSKFPNGVKSVGDYLHNRGLKLGIYINFRAGVNNIQRDADTLTSWGIDRLKVDFFGGTNDKKEYRLWRDALANTKRPVVYHICRWKFPGPWVVDVGHSWRTSGDMIDTWHDMLRNLDTNSQYAQYAGPGHWNDPDMMMVGNGGMTLEEYRTHFIMWCMMAAPLRAGNDLRHMTRGIKDILMAAEIIAIDQDPLGIQGTMVKNYGDQQVWAKPLENGMKAVALLNRGASSADITVNWTDIGLSLGDARVRDLWRRKNLGAYSDQITINTPSHGVSIIRVVQDQQTFNAPNSPQNLRCENQINPTSALTLSPWLKWIFSDPDIGDVQSAYQIIISNNRTDIDNNKGNVWDSGKIISLDSYMRYIGTNLSEGKIYYWKVRCWDQNDSRGNFSSSASFKLIAPTNIPPNKPSNLLCNNQSNLSSTTGYPPIFSWTFNDANPGDYQSSYRVLVSDNVADIKNDIGTLWDSKQTYSIHSTSVYGGEGLSNGLIYYWRVMTWDENCVPSPYSTIGSFCLTNAPGHNLLIDSGFESDGFGWQCSTANWRYVDTQEFHSGTKSQKMYINDRWPSEVYQDVQIQGGHTYEVSAWVKTDSVNSRKPFRFLLRWHDNNLNGFWNDNPNLVREDNVGSLSGNNNWKYISGRFTAPPNAVSLRFYMFMESGTAWFDDTELYDQNETPK